MFTKIFIILYRKIISHFVFNKKVNNSETMKIKTNIAEREGEKKQTILSLLKKKYIITTCKKMTDTGKLLQDCHAFLS